MYYLAFYTTITQVTIDLRDRLKTANIDVEIKTFEAEEGIKGLGDDPFVSSHDVLAAHYLVTATIATFLGVLLLEVLLLELILMNTHLCCPALPVTA